MVPMPAHAARTDPRILLFADGPRAMGAAPAAKIRRYRLARLRLDALRTDLEPRYAHLKRG